MEPVRSAKGETSSSTSTRCPKWEGVGDRSVITGAFRMLREEDNEFREEVNSVRDRRDLL